MATLGVYMLPSGRTVEIEFDQISPPKLRIAASSHRQAPAGPFNRSSRHPLPNLGPPRPTPGYATPRGGFFEVSFTVGTS